MIQACSFEHNAHECVMNTSEDIYLKKNSEKVPNNRGGGVLLPPPPISRNVRVVRQKNGDLSLFVVYFYLS